jgi:putative nucleotidyltransferase with HDIG domain
MTKTLSVPPAVWRHCRAVSTVAVTLADAVARAGGTLSRDLIRSAALLHDIARTRKNHAVAGAAILDQMGYSALAAIVRVHMDMKTSPHEPLDEAQLVYLADRLVQNDRLVSLGSRLVRSVDRHGSDIQAREAIIHRFQIARWIQEKIERLTNRSLESLLAELDLSKEHLGDE